MADAVSTLPRTRLQAVFDYVAASVHGLTSSEIFAIARADGFLSERSIRGVIAELARTGVFSADPIVGANPYARECRYTYRVRDGAGRPPSRGEAAHARSQVEAEKILELFRRGETLQSIGQKYGISRERVRQILAKIGVAVIRERTIADLVVRVQRLEAAVFGQTHSGNAATIMGAVGDTAPHNG